MKEKTDIETLEDIILLVDSFYREVRQDDLIGPIFNEVLGRYWSGHLSKMYGFWQTVLLGEHQYTGSPFPPHAKLKISTDHFSRWLQLWEKTLSKHFSGEKAAEALWRGMKMADMFLQKIEYYNNNSAKPII